MDRHPVPGRFSFSLGEVLLTAWEASRLAPGDIVLTSRAAGYPGFVLFNNLPLAVAEVVVLGETFGLRIVDTDFRPTFQVDPGRVDEVGEVIPCLVELGSLQLNLDEVRGLGRNSLVNLGVASNTVSNAVLNYSGVALATGTVVVVGELMGLRITEVLVHLSEPERVRQSGNVADRVLAAQAKTYDFTRPDKFSVQQIRRLEEVHRLVQRHLESTFPEVAARLGGRPEALLVDQCTLGEALQMLSEQGLTAAMAWEHPSSHRGGPSPAARPRVVYLETPDCPRPASVETKAFIDTLFSQQGLLGHRPIYLHSSLPWSPTDAEGFADCLRAGWRKFLDFRLEVPEAAGKGTLQVLDESEMVILVLYRAETASAPVLALVYPYLVLEPYLRLLGS